MLAMPVVSALVMPAGMLALLFMPFGLDGWLWKLMGWGISVNWGAAVVTALREGNGPAPVRGFLRLGVRLFGADVTPAAQAYDAALTAIPPRPARAAGRRKPAPVRRWCRTFLGF